MIAIAGKWVGTIQGTNSGAVFAEFVATKEGIEGISGAVHINDPVHGVGVYSVRGAVGGGQATPDDIRLVLTPHRQMHMAGHGIVTVLAHMVNPTQIAGDWRSSIGTAGTLSVTKVAVEPTGVEQPSQGAAIVPKRTKVFISYSHQDITWLERLRVHLK